MVIIMAISGQRFLLLIVGLLFFVMGCTREHVDVTMVDDPSAPPETHEPSPMDDHDAVDAAKTSYEANVAPILMAKCAISGCHVAPTPDFDPPHDLNYTTYESFIAGGDGGAIFIPGDADESEIIEEIVEGKMPPPDSGVQPITDDELQTLKDWINQQEALDHVVQHAHEDEDNIDDHHDDHGDDDHDDHNNGDDDN